MDKTPFSVYDFFAYLAAGSVVVVTVDYITGATLLRRDSFPLSLALLLTIAAYVAGQVIAHISAWLYETIFVRRFLGSPVLYLTHASRPNGFKKWFFPGYYKGLPKSVCEKITKQAERKGCAGATGEALFMHCYPVATAKLESLQGRLDDFRTQYGFARNMSCALLLSGCVILISRKHFGPSIHVRWAVAAVITALVMLYRYLKFYRQYSYELLIRYAELE